MFLCFSDPIIVDEITFSHSGRTDSWSFTNYLAQKDDLLTFSNYESKPIALFEGTVDDGVVPLSDITVNLYRRQTGELINTTATSVSGTFSLDSPYDDYHYAVALYDYSIKNALIYDYVLPTISGGS